MGRLVGPAKPARVDQTAVLDEGDGRAGDVVALDDLDDGTLERLEARGGFAGDGNVLRNGLRKGREGEECADCKQTANLKAFHGDYPLACPALAKRRLERGSQLKS